MIFVVVLINNKYNINQLFDIKLSRPKKRKTNFITLIILFIEARPPNVPMGATKSRIPNIPVNNSSNSSSFKNNSSNGLSKFSKPKDNRIKTNQIKNTKISGSIIPTGTKYSNTLIEDNRKGDQINPSEAIHSTQINKNDVSAVLTENTESDDKGHNKYLNTSESMSYRSKYKNNESNIILTENYENSPVKYLNTYSVMENGKLTENENDKKIEVKYLQTFEPVSIDWNNSGNSNHEQRKSNNQRSSSYSGRHTINTPSKEPVARRSRYSSISKDPENRKRNSKDGDRNLSQQKIFGRFYEKFSENVKKVLINNKEDVQLIGNERFKGQDVDYYLDEMINKRIYNKFSEGYDQDKAEYEQIGQILSDPKCELNKEQIRYLLNKRKIYEEKIELTPLPIIHRNSIDNQDPRKNEMLNKAQRAAVLMRRYEYERKKKKLKISKCKLILFLI